MSRFIKVDEYYVEYIYDDSSKQNILIYQSKNGGGCAVSDINFDEAKRKLLISIANIGKLRKQTA